MEQVKQNVLEGTSNWSAKLAITGRLSVSALSSHTPRELTYDVFVLRTDQIGQRPNHSCECFHMVMCEDTIEVP